MKNKVEMHPAYEWTCDDCGRQNFVSCMVAEMSEEDREEQLIAMALDEDDAARDFIGGEFVAYPDEVICDHCESVFETASRHDEKSN